MSQFAIPGAPSVPSDQPAFEPGRTSRLAISSLICSIICCLPFTTIPGILLGAGALLAIGKNAALRGRGLAITGIVLGVIFTIGQVLIYPAAWGLVKAWYEVVATGPRDAMTASRPRTMAAVSVWVAIAPSPTIRPTDPATRSTRARRRTVAPREAPRRRGPPHKRHPQEHPRQLPALTLTPTPALTRAPVLIPALAQTPAKKRGTQSQTRKTVTRWRTVARLPAQKTRARSAGTSAPAMWTARTL